MYILINQEGDGTRLGKHCWDSQIKSLNSDSSRIHYALEHRGKKEENLNMQTWKISNYLADVR